MSSSSSGGVSFLGMLAIAFIILKLWHVIGWSWWWVLSPLWGATAIVLGIVVVIMIGAAIADFYESRNRNRRRRAVIARDIAATKRPD
jgi:hypothetical protein